MLTILGGMGPEIGFKFASHYVWPEIARQLGSRLTDQAVPLINLLSRPVGDRTAALMQEIDGDPALAVQVEGELQAMVDEAAMLHSTMLVVPCNTAHAFFSKSTCRQGVDLRGMRLIDIRQAAIESIDPSLKIGLMSTRGTAVLGLYGGFQRTMVIPDEAHMQAQSEGIYAGVKAGNYGLATQRFSQVADHLLERGADVILGACTEIPMAIPPHYGCIDPLRSTARIAVEALLAGQ